MPYADPKKKSDNHKKYMREVWYPKNRTKQLTYVAKTKARISTYILGYKKAGFCRDCGFSGKEYPEVLDFDHLRDKKFEISMFHLYTNGIHKVKAEMEKCDLVCANCHRIRTAKRRKCDMSM